MTSSPGRGSSSPGWSRSPTGGSPTLVKLCGDGGEADADALARGDDGEVDGAAASARGDDGELDGAAASACGDDGEHDGAAASGVGGEARSVVGAVGS